ncbi:MAG: hypothetical protein H6822_25855 [Planctomycetaceae bacterium]|nr:hypothetical protein [Planctomycetaceae bacterium]
MTFAIRNDLALEASPPVSKKQIGYAGEIVSGQLVFSDSGKFFVAAGGIRGPDADGLYFFDSESLCSVEVTGESGQELPINIPVSVEHGKWALALFRRVEEIPTEESANLSLTESAAMNLLNQGDCSFSHFKRIEEGAARLLMNACRLHSGIDNNIYLNALTELNPEVATILATHDGGLSFGSLTSITTATANALARHKGNLYLSGLRALSAEFAQALSLHGEPVHFEHLTSIESREGIFLAAKNGLDDYDLEALNEETARAIVDAASGRPIALALPHLAAQCARELAAHRGDIWLDVSEALSLSTAEFLGSHHGQLDLYLGDAELTSEVARALAKHKGPLYIHMSQLSVSAAECLAAVEAPLGFPLLQLQSSDVAKALASHQGELLLANERVDDEVVAELCKHRGFLRLDSIETLSESAASMLANHQGDVSLVSVELTTEAARTLGNSKTFFILPFVLGQDESVLGEKDGDGKNLDADGNLHLSSDSGLELSLGSDSDLGLGSDSEWDLS